MLTSDWLVGVGELLLLLSLTCDGLTGAVQERMKLEKLRLEEERKRAMAQKTEMSQRMEETSRLEELKRLDEQRRLERERLEHMIIQGMIRIIEKQNNNLYFYRVQSCFWPSCKEIR